MTIGMKGFLGSKQNNAVAETTTFEGGKAYALNLEEKLCNAFTLGMIQGNFYTSQEDVIKNCRELFSEALAKDPELATKYAIYSSENLGMKLFPTLWLVYLSTLDDKTLFKKAFPRIIGKNVKMMHDFVDICRSSDIRPGGIHKQKIKSSNKGLGQGVKKVINKHAYNILNEYNATRFTGNWEDIFRLTRIEDKAVFRKDEKTGELFVYDTKPLLQYIFKPNDGTGRRLTFERARLLQETIDILQDDSRTPVQFVKALENIKAQKLQMDEIKFTFGKLSLEEKQKVFEYFIPGLRYAALVTNLVAIERAFATSTRVVKKLDPMGSGKTFNQTEVLETNIPGKLIDIVSRKLKDFNDYKASKLLFFRLLTAHEMIITSKWKDALNDVLTQAGTVAFADIPVGRTIRCSADTSGSMSISVTSSLKAVDIAAYLTASIALSTPDTKAYATASISNTVALSGNNLIDNAIRIKNADVGHGTAFGTLIEGYAGEDVVILVTDGQQSDDMERKWQSLKNRPANSRLIIWHVAGWDYFNRIAEDSSVIYLKGYNDNLLNVLANLITGKAGQPELVKNVVI